MPSGKLGSARTAAATLAAGAAGGWLASLAGLPLAWMLGAMWTVVLLSGRMQQVAVPRWIGRLALAAIGCFLGANFTPAAAAQLQSAAGAIAMVAILTAALAAMGAVAISRLLGASASTAILSSAPGGLSLLLVLAGGYRSDHAVISVIQVIRIIIIASIIPLWAQLSADGAPSPQPEPAAAHGLAWLLLAFAGGIGIGSLFNSAHMFLFSAIAVAAALSMLDVSAGQPPGWMLACAQVALGSTVGSRVSLRRLAATRRTALLAVALGLAYLTAAALAALAARALAGGPFMVWLLAFAPGGIAEITLVAQLLGLQPVFVLCVQLARLMLVIALTPIALRLVCGPAGPRTAAGKSS